ncbi:MAG: Dihydrofolate reductase [Candidatus Nomurabacteria bacterium GW2011_GWF2_35_66]|uniref:Dihydrofolate reductase n=1 Tax=Candidatus Nomurabacteria bacterium GW2011_GWE1_35_16 TaxID=1618761 RepID=A0A0G0BT01_9BACT|nr:MAG: Dihydrofolate reductase [Candidatus Nomurabacteria bacterium GW2011_GWF1_34_20]KKP63674.1 MAG: Dihydrofolate reductase [Candidatus Nomurabacteria bacterium GW2011_GWE2_34_25]KKP66876.1 MAG: Dihydrofolate reductase [Candidatus Nomurabacteria bacterium GW2011_GWE1_35_16]KKP83502.1 MAG: Dihydrofolate reductase [Candidatus Nomurabacteria bacterium GW2011_GWF2_35_66]HAE36566.1 dihydrofolate reductase [Candidatus Nomurabacteria bacterium]
MILSIISAIANNNEIGRKNDLLWDLPIDMKHFRETTRGHTVIMGQRTFESLGIGPDGNPGKPLPNRRNIILTLDKSYKRNDAEVVYSLEELDELLKNSTKEEEELFVIGGGQIYKLFIDKVDRLYITHVNADFPDADTLFPTIDKDKWKIISEDKHEKDEQNIYDCNFVIYERIGK